VNGSMSVGDPGAQLAATVAISAQVHRSFDIVPSHSNECATGNRNESSPGGGSTFRSRGNVTSQRQGQAAVVI
jgi:hypothetical protein